MAELDRESLVQPVPFHSVTTVLGEGKTGEEERWMKKAGRHVEINDILRGCAPEYANR